MFHKFKCCATQEESVLQELCISYWLTYILGLKVFCRGEWGLGGGGGGSGLYGGRVFYYIIIMHELSITNIYR